MKLLKYYIQSIKMVISKEMMYRTNFIIRMLTLFAFEIMGPLVTYLIYKNSNGLPDWSIDQILLLQSIFLIINAIEKMLFQRVDWSLSHTVRNGNFDRFLLYPIDTLTLISASNFVPEQIFTFLVGCTIFTMTFIKLGITLSIIQILQFIALILFGFVFMYSIAMIKFSIIIRVVVITRIGEFFRTVKRFARYPMDVYGNVLSSFFRYIFPLIILAEFPTLVLLDKPMNNLGIVLIVIILFYFISRYYWLNTLKKYTSTGG